MDCKKPEWETFIYYEDTLALCCLCGGMKAKRGGYWKYSSSCKPHKHCWHNIEKEVED